MKRVLSAALLGGAFLFFVSCGGGSETATHTHDDGTTHADHDTSKPAQQEFLVQDSSAKDTTATHVHKDGEPHAH